MIECGKNGGLLFRVLLFRFVSERCGAADEALAWNSYSQCGAVCDAAWGQCRFLVTHMDVRGLASGVQLSAIRVDILDITPAFWFDIGLLPDL